MQLPLSLLFIDAANPRSRRDPAFVKSLAASIAAEGLIEPLHVKGPYADGRFGVVNGGSRLEALQSLHPGEDPAVECQKVADDIAADPARLKSAALAPNVMRAALHPVDAFEAFAALQKAGFTEAHIAERYSVDAAIVRQRLRLANLAPEIRAAWRAGAISAEAAEAFTLSDDIAAQSAVFKKLGGSKQGSAIRDWIVRQELVGDTNDERRFFKCVGREAYEAAGGRLARFLFVDDDDEGEVIGGADTGGVILDFPILKSLADQMIAEKCEALLKQGWAFAEAKDAHENAHSWRRINAKTKEEKASSGCLISIDWHGKLQIERGLVKPGTKAPKKKAAKTSSHSEEGGPDRTGKAAEDIDAKPLSATLIQALTEAFTYAAQDAVATDTDLALRILVAATTPDLFGAPALITIKHNFRDGDNASDEGPDVALYDFADIFEGLKAATRDELLSMLTARVARSIDLTEQSPLTFANYLTARDDFEYEDTREEGAPPPLPDAAVIANAVPALPFTAALEIEFEKTEYFSRAGKLRAIAAIGDVDPEYDVGPLLKKSAKELAAIASDKTRGTGWLPPELRTIHYRGTAARKEG